MVATGRGSVSPVAGSTNSICKAEPEAELTSTHFPKGLARATRPLFGPAIREKCPASTRKAAPGSAPDGLVYARYFDFPRKEMRIAERGVVKTWIGLVPSWRRSDATEPFTPEARVSMPADETAMSARFWDKKKLFELLAESAYVLMVENCAPER